MYITAVQIFGEKQRNTVIINKALYDTLSSGSVWHDKLSDNLRDMIFLPCKIEPDIWMI